MSPRRQAMAHFQRGIRMSGPIALERRRAMLGYDALQEIEHQFQVPIEGMSGSVAAYTTAELAFDVDFFDAPEQRDSPFSVPHFTFGAVVDGADVMVSASVKSWRIDGRGAIVGATVTIGVSSPGTTTQTAYAGYVHLTFQGYGALSENVETLDVGT